MKLHEADPDVVAYQEIRLQGKDNVVCAQTYDKEGREYQREWAQGVPLLVRRGLSVVQDKKVGAMDSVTAVLEHAIPKRPPNRPNPFISADWTGPLPL